MRWGHVDDAAPDVSGAGRRRPVAYSEGLFSVESHVGTYRPSSTGHVSASGRAGGGRVFDQLAVEAGLPRSGPGASASDRRTARRRKRKRPGLGVEQVEDAAGLLSETAKSVWRRGR